MKIYIIGRQGDIQIQNESVSLKHAKLSYVTATDLLIEDLDSTNGTCVNGKRIKRKRIKLTDEVVLGEYAVDLKAEISRLPKTDEDVKTRFKELEEVYKDYSESKVKLQSKTAVKSAFKRMIPMALPGLLISLICLLIPAANITVIQVLSGILTSAGLAMGAAWGAVEQGKIPERINELEEQFKLDYVCPDCQSFLGNTPWKGLDNRGHCSYCKRKFK